MGQIIGEKGVGKIGVGEMGVILIDSHVLTGSGFNTSQNAVFWVSFIQMGSCGLLRFKYKEE